MRPLDLRPISVMSVLYRVWSAARVRQILDWQEGWVSRHLKGFRLRLGCLDAFWDVALKVEAALLDGDGTEALCGLSLDFQKALIEYHASISSSSQGWRACPTSS